MRGCRIWSMEHESQEWNETDMISASGWEKGEGRNCAKLKVVSQHTETEVDVFLLA